MHQAYIILLVIIYLTLLGWFISGISNGADLEEADLYNGKSMDDVGV